MKTICLLASILVLLGLEGCIKKELDECYICTEYPHTPAQEKKVCGFDAMLVYEASGWKCVEE